MNKTTYAVLFSIYALFASIGLVQADEGRTPIAKTSDQWRFEVTPYLWAPGINSTLNYKDQYVKTADLSANNIISNLKSGAMIAGEAHYGNWGVLADVVSATLQKTSNTSVTPQAPYTYQIATKATLQQTILTGCRNL